MNTPIPLRLSPSAIRAYRACSYRYARDYVDRLADEARVPVPVFAFGGAIHKALAAFIRQGGAAKRSLDDLVASLQRHWEPLAFGDEKKSQAEFARARAMLENFYANPYATPGAHELALESNLTWKIPRRGILAVGRLDRVCLQPNGVLEVIDYKTGLTLPTVEEAEDDLQTVLYHTLAVDNYRHLNPTELRITYLYLAGPVPLTLVPDRAAQLKRWAGIEETAALIREDRADYESGMPLAEAFPPNRGSGCQFCPMRAHCHAKFPSIPSLFSLESGSQGEIPPLVG